MALFGPDTCATLLALLAALAVPGTHDQAVSMAAQTSREAVTLVNAYDQGCESCIERVRAACPVPEDEAYVTR